MKLVFKPRARLLLQLGDQLIKNESVALLELVKNSYDADANCVDVLLEDIDDPSRGSILIIDDGSGMDLEIIKNVWMEPGSDYKEQLFKAQKCSEKYKRLPIGEKGVGRFGAHKLGYEIELVTRMAGKAEIYLKIDWNSFSKSKYLDEVPIELYERPPQIFKGTATGTQITITNLKCKWTRVNIRELYRAINALCSPFKTPDHFEVKFEILDENKKDWLKGLLSWEEVKTSALYYFKCQISGGIIKEFLYEFKPWVAMTKLKPRKITHHDMEIEKKKYLCTENEKREPVLIDLSNYKIGPVTFEGYIFDRDASTLRLGIQDKRGLKEYLDSNGGIKVYRDGMRIYDYGEPGNDWLDLDERRFNTPGKKISNNLVIASVGLKRADSSGLIEKTNREGFVESDAYFMFRNAILYVLSTVETFRYIDKDQVRQIYGVNAKSEPVLSTLNEMRITIEKKVKDEETKKEFFKYLTRVEAEYKYINETLLKSAGAGLSLSVVIHEMEKVIEILQNVIRDEKPSQRIVELVKRMSDLMDGYSEILRNPGNKFEDLTKIIDQTLFNVEYRLNKHKIEIVKEYKKNDSSRRLAKCSKSLLLSTLLNIVDNSIWWLKYSNEKSKKVYIALSDEIPDCRTIIIADNGPGFSLPTDQIIKPFVSAKPHGIGLGLHIAHEATLSQGGKLFFPDGGDFDIPEEFRNGAVIALCFGKEKNK